MTAPLPPEECGTFDLGCKVDQATDNALTNMANSVIEGVGDFAATMATFWMDTGSPDLGSEYETGGFEASPTVQLLTDSTRPLVMALAVLAVILAGAKTAWDRRLEPVKELVQGLFRLMVVQGAGLTGITLALVASESYARWVVGQSTDNFGEDLVAMLALESNDYTSIGTVAVVLLIGGIALFASFLQILFLIARNAFLLVLAATWPLAAAGYSMPLGRVWYQRHTAWLIAYLLYLPTASIIYAAAFTLTGDASPSGDPNARAVQGVGLMILSVVALPALLTLVVPALEAVTSRGGGGAGAAAALAAAPIGARVVQHGRSSGGGGGPSGAGPGSGGGPRGSGPGGGGPGGGSPSGGPSGSGSRGAAVLAAARAAWSSGSSTPPGPPGSGGTPPPGGTPPRPTGAPPQPPGGMQ